MRGCAAFTHINCNHHTFYIIQVKNEILIDKAAVIALQHSIDKMCNLRTKVLHKVLQNNCFDREICICEGERTEIEQRLRYLIGQDTGSF